MYNLYNNKNRTDDLGGQKLEDGIDFYIPVGAILVELQNCPNNLARIESDNIYVTGSDFNDIISVCTIEVLAVSDGESK